MKITVTTTTDKIFFLDVSEELELENFKAFCEVESGITGSQMVVVFNGKPLVDNQKPLKHFGIKDGDCVVLQIQRPPAAARTNLAASSRGTPMDLGKFFFNSHLNKIYFSLSICNKIVPCRRSNTKYVHKNCTI